MDIKRALKKVLPPALVVLAATLIGWKKIFAYPRFFFQYGEFKKQLKASKRAMPMRFRNVMPYLSEATKTTGFDHHYIYHPAWAARILAKIKPIFHVDISSTLHFCTLVSAFLPVRFYDFRPAKLELENLVTGQADLTRLPFQDNEIQSLSCMHTVEHIGLGRYGDALDPNSDLKAMSELARVLTQGGNLLFVVPIGQPKIIFNAHRIYAYRQILENFKNLELKEFSLITDDGLGRDFIKDASETDADRQSYGCGCFWFQKPKTTLTDRMN